MAIRLPVLDWLPHYRRADLPRDLLAGLMGTLSTAPEAMAYALLAGLPTQMGLYSLLLPLLAYFLFGTSRDLSLSPTATLAAILALTVGPVAAGDPERYVALAILVAWLVGAILLVAGLLRLGYVANFVSRPVLSGYFAGTAIVIAVAQVGQLLGIGAHGLDLPTIASAMLRSRSDLRLDSAVLGLGLLALLFLLRAIGHHRLGPALVVVVGMIAVRFLGLEVQVIGDLAVGLPPLTLPSLGGGAVPAVLPGALTLALLVFLDSAAVARQFASEKQYRIDLDQELRALGSANLAAGLTGAVAVSGNLGDTVLLDEAGARTPLVGLVTVALVVIILLVGASFPNIPLAAFAAIVIYAVLQQPRLHLLQRTRHFDRAEFRVGIACLLGVLFLGPLRGLLLAVGLTVLMLLSRASRPHVAELGYVSDPVPALVQVDSRPGASRVPGARILQPIGGLFFPSVGGVADAVRRRLVTREADLRFVVLDLRAVPFVDMTACETLAGLAKETVGAGARLVVARANAGVEEKLRRSGLADILEPPGGLQSVLALLQLPHDVRDHS